MAKSPKNVKDAVKEEEAAAEAARLAGDTPQAHPDAAIMTGFTNDPAAESDDPTDEDEDDEGEAEGQNLVEVTIGGIRYMVAPAVAASMNASPDPTRQNIDTRESEDPQEDDFTVDEAAFFSDPTTFLKKFRDEVKTEITQDLTRQYGKQKNQDDFWNEFYVENRDLSKYKDIVKVVFDNNLNTLSTKTVADASKELGNMSRSYILQIAKDFNKKGGKGENLTQTLTGSTKSAPASNNEEAEKDQTDEPTSLSDAIRRRANSRESSQRVV